MKPKPEDSVPRAYIKAKYLNGYLPDGNPFKLPKVNLPNKNTKEYKAIIKLVNDVLNRPHKATPSAGSKIAY